MDLALALVGLVSALVGMILFDDFAKMRNRVFLSYF